jgi:hypothetical protein
MQVETTRGRMDSEQLERIVGVEDRPGMMALWVEFRVKGDETRALVRRDAFPIAKQTGDVITTTLGPMPRAQFARVVELEDAENELVVAEVFKDRSTGAIVHRSVHVVLKAVEATGVAAAIGG